MRVKSGFTGSNDSTGPVCIKLATMADSISAPKNGASITRESLHHAAQETPEAGRRGHDAPRVDQQGLVVPKLRAQPVPALPVQVHHRHGEYHGGHNIGALHHLPALARLLQLVRGSRFVAVQVLLGHQRTPESCGAAANIASQVV